MAEKNSTLLGRFYLSGSNDTAQRLDNPTQGSIAKTVKQLFAPMNQDIYNQFANFMVQRIGYSFARAQQWENPLKEFIKQKLYFGSTVTETQLNWIKGHAYNVDAEEQFKTHYPDGLQAFHSINFQMQYPISVSREQLRQAFADEFGLNQLVASIMQQPLNADEYDTYNAMLDLFAMADINYNLYRHQLSAAPTDEATCKEFLQALQQYSFDLQVPTTLYSCVDLPVVVKEQELVLFIRSDAMAATNVQALAVLFNLDKAEIPYRIKVIPSAKWSLKSTDYAVLTTSDFFQVYPIEYSTTSQWDAQGLKTNYWLNDWKTISFSPFVPIIVFSTEAGTTPQTVKVEPTGLTVTAEPTTIEAGETTQLTAKLAGTVSPAAEGVEVAPESCIYEVSATDSTGASVKLNTRTYVDRYGVLHTQKTLTSGTTVKLTCTSTYFDPSTLAENDALTADVEVTIK